MNEPMTVLDTGQDRRMSYAAQRLAKTAKVYSCGLTGACPEVIPLSSPAELPRAADLLLLPMMKGSSTVASDSGRLTMAELAQAAKPGAVAAGGLMSDALLEELSALGLRAVDYFRSEELQIKNALLTAEGALSVIASQSEEAIYGMPVLIVGWGRVAKACARLLSACGARVTVSARSSAALAEAGCFGCGTLPMPDIACRADSFRVMVNTVPAPVITAEIIRRTQRNCLIVDLASKPGGTDASACALHGVSFVHALSLPGKYAPKTAGEIIAETVCDMIEKLRPAEQ